MKSSILLLTICTVTFACNVSATPNGAGSCAAGIAAIETENPNADGPRNRHIQYAGFPGSTETRPGNSGTLFEGATIVTLNGEPLVPNASNRVPSGAELVWEITAQQVAFKGLLVRVEKASDDFTVVGSDDTLQNSALCDAFPGVIGVTHVTNTPKPVSSGTMSFTSGGTATLDITVVYDNVMSSLYAFNTFELLIEGVETPAPVDVPAAPPVTVPTPLPVPSADTPTVSPTQTDAPLLPPTLSPVPTNLKGMMKGGMDKGMMKGGMDKGGMKNAGMDKGGMKNAGMDEGGMKNAGKEKLPKEEKEPKVPKEKGSKETKVPKEKNGNNMDGMKVKKGNDDDETPGSDEPSLSPVTP
jgi:hypothetical protein